MQRISLGERLGGLVSAQTRKPIFTWTNSCMRPTTDIVWRSAAIRSGNHESCLSPSWGVGPAPSAYRGRPDGTLAKREQPSSNESNPSGRVVRAANDGSWHDSRGSAA